MGVMADPGQIIFLTKVLISTSLTYMVLTLPSAIYIVMLPHVSYKQLEPVYTSQDAFHGAMHLWDAISLCLLYINHSVNFFLYCLADTKFKDEFKAIINSIFCK